MTGPIITLKIDASSTEGIHDFLDVLGGIQEKIKEGSEGGMIKIYPDMPRPGMKAEVVAYWKIQTHGPEDRDETTVAVFPLRDDSRDITDRRYPEAGI